MRKLLFAFFLTGILQPGYSQNAFDHFWNYWQQEVNFTIDVSLNDKEHTLTGFEKIEYINNSPDTLRYIWFHVWPNAYKNDKTAFSDQMLEQGDTRFYFSDKEQKGYINRLDFRVNDTRATIEDHPEHIDIIKLNLPKPLPPRQSITITTPFHVKLPENYSRGGHEGESYQITQWYPKPAVYDKQGWHPMPYLNLGEFYSDFGKYDVRITLPSNYVVAATGNLENISEKEWLRTRKDFEWQGKLFPVSSNDIKTLRYTQTNVHDFAWFADKRFVVNHDTCRLGSGKIIDVYTYYTPEYKKTWLNSVQYAKDAVRHYSALVGEYPYSVVQAVQGPDSFGGGMEYPTITVLSPGGSPEEIDYIIAHEIGHNWFYGILASNERQYPWMDEGINTYYDAKYNLGKYGKKPSAEQLAFETKAVTKMDQPIGLPADQYTAINYGLSVYYKTGQWLSYLEKTLGTETFNKGMREYYRRWQFRHPQPADFKGVMEEAAGRKLDTEFSLLNSKGMLPGEERKGTKIAFAFSGKKLIDDLTGPSKNLVLFGPAFGYNSYDKAMAGLFVTNMKFPPTPFQYLFIPLYAFGSEKLSGIGLASYTFYPDRVFRKVDIGVTGSYFTGDKFTDQDGKNNFLRFRKTVPGLRLVLREKSALSSMQRYFQFRTFIIGEDGLRFYRDTLSPGPPPVIKDRYEIIKNNRTLNQLRYVIDNNRGLYPYRAELKAEQGRYFVRLGFTGNYFFNYPKGGGLDVRLFAGKFIYTSTKTFLKQFATDRYHLNMTGANGYEDYTYSDYFVGRNDFDGWQSQQIMNRDGFFKVRTDLLADKPGRTDDWLLAGNFTSSIPAGINPFNLLPVKLPIKLFLDLGTYAEAWKQNAETNRFLYDAGIYLPLLKETFNIYIPLLYSSVYSDYYKSTIPKNQRFWKKISFTIDVSNFNFRKIDRNLDF